MKNILLQYNQNLNTCKVNMTDFESFARKYANKMVKRSKTMLIPESACSYAVTEIFSILDEFHPKALRTLIEELNISEEQDDS